MKKLLYSLAAAHLMETIVSDLKRRGWERFVGGFTQLADTAKEGSHNSRDLQEFANVIVTQVINMLAERGLHVVTGPELIMAQRAGVYLNPIDGSIPRG